MVMAITQINLCNGHKMVVCVGYADLHNNYWIRKCGAKLLYSLTAVAQFWTRFHLRCMKHSFFICKDSDMVCRQIFGREIMQTCSSAVMLYTLVVVNEKKFSPMRDWWSTPLQWLSVTRDLDLDLDLGSDHTAYHCASLIDLYVHTKFHWNRKNFFLDGLTAGTPPSSRSHDTKNEQISKIRPNQI